MRKTSAAAAVAMLALPGFLAFGQKLEFEVASVRAAPPPGPQARGMRGGPGTPDPTRFTATYVQLGDLLIWAYNLPYDQISGPSWISGPPQLSTDQYDVIATVPAGATREQFQVMLQNLLADRFKMTSHFIKKDFEGYEMTVAKGGLKMKEFVIDPKAPSDRDASGFPIIGPQGFKDGFPQLPPGNSPRLSGNDVNGRMLYTARQQDMAAIVRTLQNGLAIRNGLGFAGVRVVDKTGLTGKYDFHLQYALPSGSGGTRIVPPGGDYLDSIGEPAPDIVTAVQQQLGLTLTKGKVALDVLVIDHVEKVPTQN